MKMLNQIDTLNDMNMPVAGEHLTDDQLDDHLIGDLSAAAAEHLSACSLCLARVDQTVAPIASFQTVSLAWSERVSATAPMPPIAAGQPLWERRMAWSLALAICAVGVGLAGVGQRLLPARQATASVVSTQSTTASMPTEAQISSDNQLLNTVDSELNPSSESPAALGLVPVSAAVQHRAANPAFQD